MITLNECILSERERKVYDKIKENPCLLSESLEKLNMALEKFNVPHCSECECMKMYDYLDRIYYCDHEDRTDDMGKLGVEHPPKTSPEWCPKRVNEENFNKTQENNMDKTVKIMGNVDVNKLKNQVEEAQNISDESNTDNNTSSNENIDNFQVDVVGSMKINKSNKCNNDF